MMNLHEHYEQVIVDILKAIRFDIQEMRKDMKDKKTDTDLTIVKQIQDLKNENIAIRNAIYDLHEKIRDAIQKHDSDTASHPILLDNLTAICESIDSGDEYNETRSIVRSHLLDKELKTEIMMLRSQILKLEQDLLNKIENLSSK